MVKIYISWRHLLADIVARQEGVTKRVMSLPNREILAAAVRVSRLAIHAYIVTHEGFLQELHILHVVKHL